METIEKSTLTLLSDLAKNNDREWFSKNRSRYEPAKANFERFVQGIINELIPQNPILKGLEAKSCIFRINRDIRFSKDKSVYKTNFGAFIVRGGRKNGDRYTGYYIHLEPGGNSMLAGGSYMPPMPWLTEIREKISENGEKFLKIINNKEFADFFGPLDGERLKSAPKGFSSDNKYIEYLKMKSFVAIRMISDKEVTSEGYPALILKGSKIMKPLNDFLDSE
jgi:uncharacterized protein (TIGR02453 family)